MMRLQKFLALSGVASRRNSEKLIADGHVAVNGKVITEMGVQVDESADVVTVDGKVCKIQEEKHYLAYNKPMGEVTTVADPEGRPTVMDKFRDYPVRLYPVGRLDYDSEGLLLLTNDGDLLNALTHPRHEVEKHYEVRVRGNLENIPKLAEPMEIDGYSIRPATVVTIDRDEISAKLRLTIHEGRNRQIRRMCEAVGLEVIRLKRSAEGPVKLGMLQPGEYRELKKSEISALRNAALKAAPARKAAPAAARRPGPIKHD